MQLKYKDQNASKGLFLHHKSETSAPGALLKVRK